jgi:hypothetical protein
MKKTILLFAGIMVLGLLIPLCLNAQVMVNGNKSWVKTKIQIAIDDRVQVQAVGTVTLDPNVTCSADGLKIVSGPEHVAIKGVNRGALIARIGKKGVPFQIGSNGQFIAGSSGWLYFGINDDAVKNNSGAYNLTITINGQSK